MTAVRTEPAPVPPLPRHEPAPRPGRAARLRKATPYVMLVPALAVLLAILAYPLYLLGTLAFQRKNLSELISGRTVWVGLDNFRELLGRSEFWHVVGRTLAFTAVNVALTMVLAMLVALLMQRLGPQMRGLLSLTLVAVWAMPVLVAIVTWRWLVDTQYGVINAALDRLPGVHFVGHNWFERPVQGLGVITAVVVWGAIPFAVITLYAGLTQVPRELVEAAQLDGAGPWQVFRNVVVPVLRPVLIIVTSLELIWDFQVFNQVWIMLDNQPSPDYYLIGVYAFVQSFRVSHYGMGAATAVVMVVIMLAITFVYVRQILASGEIE